MEMADAGLVCTGADINRPASFIGIFGSADRWRASCPPCPLAGRQSPSRRPAADLCAGGETGALTCAFTRAADGAIGVLSRHRRRDMNGAAKSWPTIRR